MNELEKLRAWKQLKEMVAKIHDQKTRQMYYQALLARATNEWGFNPEKPGDKKPNFEYLELDDWEKEFVEDINDSITFGFNVRKQKQNTEFLEMRRNLRYFITHGGKLADIPEDIRTPYIVKAYFKEFLFEIQETLESLEYIIKGAKNDNNTW